MTQPVPTVPVNAATAPEAQVPVRDAAGNYGTVPESQLRDALASGNFTPATQEDVRAARVRADAEKRGTVEALTQGFGSATLAPFSAAATLLGAPDVAKTLTIPGLSAKYQAWSEGAGPEREAYIRSKIAEQGKALEETHPIAAGIGELAGFLNPVYGGIGGAAEKGTAFALSKAGIGATSGLLGRTTAAILPRVASEAAMGGMVGAEQYINDAALGDHDLRAQELLAAMGGGALIGGALGGGLGILGAGKNEIVGLGRRLVGKGAEGTPALGEMLVSGGKGLAGKIDDVAQPLIDANAERLGQYDFEKYLKSTGATQKQLRKVTEALEKDGVHVRAKQIAFDEAPRSIGLEEGSIQSREQGFLGTNTFRKQTGERIGNVYGEAEQYLPAGVDVVTPARDIRTFARKELSTVAERPVRDTIIRFADELEENYAKRNANGIVIDSNTSLKNLHNERMKLDDLIYKAEYGLKDTPLARGYERVRNILQDHLYSNVERAASGMPQDLAGELRALNQDYSIASRLTTAWAKGLERDASNRTFSLSALLGAGHGGIIGSMLGGPVGMLAGSAIGSGTAWLTKHYGDQAIAQVAHQLSKGATISEVASMTAQEIGKGVRRALGSDVGSHAVKTAKVGYDGAKGLLGPVASGTVKSIRTAGRLAEAGVSVAAPMGKIATVRALNPAKFEKIRSDLNERKNDNTIIASEVMSTGIHETHQEVAKSLIAAAQNANDYLWSKLPPEVLRPSMSGPKAMPPTSDQLREFAKYVKAVDDPLSILDDLHKSDVSPATVETLKAVYPKLYSEVETEVRLAVAGNDKIAYDKKISLGIMFGQPVDPTLTPEYLQAMSFAASSAMPQRGSGRGTRSSAVDSMIKTISPPPARALRPTVSLATRAQKLSSR